MGRSLQYFRWAGLITAIVIAMYWAIAYKPSEFRGAGPLQDDGFFSYYRYHAPVGEFPFNAEGAYQFPFSGLPSEEMVLMFYILGYNTKNRTDIEALTTVLSAEIVDASGRVICSASASPAMPSPNTWTLMSGPFEAAYWHQDCVARQYSRRAAYSLRVKVQAPDPKSPKVTLRAMLEGGGNELP